MKDKKIVSASSILVICGTALCFGGTFTFGVILTTLGILGSIIDYAMVIQKENQEKEEREKLYDGIKSSLVQVPFLGSIVADEKDSIH